MHKPESGLENETDEILWDLEIQTEQPITTRRLDPVLIKEKKWIYYLVPSDSKIKEKRGRWKAGKYLDLAWGLKKLWSM